MTVTDFNARGPFEVGARITWTHFYPDGQIIERTGTVWDRAPATNGAVVVSWVIPDEPLDSDLYSAIPVGKANARSVTVHGTWFEGCSEHYAKRGQAYSSNYVNSPLGNLAVNAERQAHAVRSARAAA